MRFAVLVLAIGMLSPAALAQPSPKPPLTVAFARQLAADYARALKVLAQQTTLAGRVSARRDIARVLARGLQETQSFRLPDEPNANPELERLVGFGFADLNERVDRAWEACVDEVRKGHGLDDAGRECLQAAWPIWIERRYVLTPAAAFTVGSADASSKVYAATAAELEAKPKSRELRRRVAAMALATTDYATVVKTLAPVSDGYDEAVTLAEAYRALESGDEAERVLVEAIAQNQRRPEAHHALAFLLKERLFEAQHDKSKAVSNRHAIFARAWRHMLCYLCLRTGAALPEPANAFESAAEAADELDGGMNGNGTHWGWRSDTPQPLPFLPNAVLPADMQADPSVRPARTCEQAVAAALQPEEDNVVAGEPQMVEQSAVGVPLRVIPPRPRPAPPRVAPQRSGCAGCATEPVPSPSAWTMALIALGICCLARRSRSDYRSPPD